MRGKALGRKAQDAFKETDCKVAATGEWLKWSSIFILTMLTFHIYAQNILEFHITEYINLFSSKFDFLVSYLEMSQTHLFSSNFLIWYLLHVKFLIKIEWAFVSNKAEVSIVWCIVRQGSISINSPKEKLTQDLTLNSSCFSYEFEIVIVICQASFYVWVYIWGLILSNFLAFAEKHVILTVII